MRPSRVTLAHVARSAGVSRTTASFVLSGRRDMRISEAAREQVLRAAVELDYRPNLTARSLRTKVSHTIAFVSDTIATEPYAGQVVHGSLAAAAARGHSLIVGETEGDVELEASVIQNFIDRQADAFIYAAMFTRAATIPAAIRGERVVLLNCTTDDLAVATVIPDEHSAGRAAVRELIDAGHRDGIVLVGEPAPTVFAGQERVGGIRHELAEHATALAGIIDCGWQPPMAYHAVRRFLQDDENRRSVRALICLNDRVAFGTYQAIAEVGLAIPDDVSVVSFDDSVLAGWLRPGLTSIALPHYEMGHRAVELVLEEHPSGVHRIAMTTATRESVAPPRRSSR